MIDPHARVSQGHTHALQPHRHLQPLTRTCRDNPAPTPSSPGSHRLGQARFTLGGYHYPQLLTRGCLPSEEELTLTRENSIRRLHSHHSDPRNQVCAKVGCILGAGAPLRTRSAARPQVWPPLTQPRQVWSCSGFAGLLQRAPFSNPLRGCCGKPPSALVSGRDEGGMRVGVGEVRMFASRREWTGQAGGKVIGGRLGEDRGEEAERCSDSSPMCGPCSRRRV